MALSDKELLAEAVMLIRDIAKVCTAGDSCKVCGEVFGDGPMPEGGFPVCAVFSAAQWADVYFPETPTESLIRRVNASKAKAVV